MAGPYSGSDQAADQRHPGCHAGANTWRAVQERDSRQSGHRARRDRDPYVVRSVAPEAVVPSGRRLCRCERPEPCCSAGSTGSTALPARSIPSARTTATTVSFSTRRAQRRRPMSSTNHGGRRTARKRLSARLDDCQRAHARGLLYGAARGHRQRRQRRAPAPSDRDQGRTATVDLFIGERRGTLNGSQRAEVLSFAAEWRREATGGILIDVPAGSSNAAAAANAAREVRAILLAAGVPSIDAAARNPSTRARPSS